MWYAKSMFPENFLNVPAIFCYEHCFYLTSNKNMHLGIFEWFYIFKSLLIAYIYLFLCVCKLAKMYIWSSEDNFQESVLLSPHGSKDSNSVIRAWWQVPFPPEPAQLFHILSLSVALSSMYVLFALCKILFHFFLSHFSVRKLCKLKDKTNKKSAL